MSFSSGWPALENESSCLLDWNLTKRKARKRTKMLAILLAIVEISEVGRAGLEPATT